MAENEWVSLGIRYNWVISPQNMWSDMGPYTEINCMTLGPPTVMFVCFGRMFEATHLGFGRGWKLQRSNQRIGVKGKSNPPEQPKKKQGSAKTVKN